MTSSSESGSMIRELKLHKSAGVPVTAAVHRLVARANRARDGRDWFSAARDYRQALERAPELAHIWIQYGHALKEGGDTAEARLAYEKALALQPRSAEAHLQLGHLHKIRGDSAAASRSYLRAAEANPHHPEALAELHGLAGRDAGVRPQDLLSILRAQDETFGDATARIASPGGGVRDLLRGLFPTTGTTGGLSDRAASVTEAVSSEPAARDEAARDGATGSTLVFDVSDLMSYFRNARLPTGIQRVQIEIITSAVKAGSHGVQICAFVEHRDDWLEIPRAAFLELCHLSLTGGDLAAPAWVSALTRLQILTNMAEAIVFPNGAFLINLGTSWWLQNYFLFVRQAKTQHGIRYVPFVHDLIPVMAREHCTKELTQDFISWAVGAFDHGDFFLVNSEATKRDLLRVADLLGHDVAPEAVVVIRLDADFRKASTTPAPKNALTSWGLGHAPFVLFVSTVESRKNHLGALEAWIALIGRHGSRNVPKLVCVGNRGWLNSAVYDKLDTHEGLRDRVVMLSGLSDAELALLYRSCLFTLYPSRYEGWGLPVTESLCYGKVPLISDASSLPEAGGPFAVYFESGSTPRLVEALDSLIYDQGLRQDRERMIADAFKPRSWADLFDQIAATVATWAARPGRMDAAPSVVLGAYYPIVRNFETRIWPGMRSAEIYRAGDGWWGPDNWGCWTKPQGGRLEMALPEQGGPLRLYLRIHGLPTIACPYSVQVTGAAEGREGVLAPTQFKWLAFDIDPASASTLSVTLQGLIPEGLADATKGLDRRIVSLGVAGFLLCRADDMIARAAFLEAVALGNLDDLAFNRERVPPAIDARR